MSRYSATRATIQCSQGCDTALGALRHGAGALRHSRQHATRAWRWCWVCRDIACNTAYQACDTVGQACDTVGQACETAGLDQDTAGEGATTRPSERHDTAPSSRCVRGLGAVRAQWACSLGQGVHLVHPTQF